MDSCSFFRGILLLCLALIASSDATTLVPTQVLVPLSSPEAVQWASIAKYAATVANQRWAGAYAISVDIVDAGGDPFSTTTAAQSAGANSTVLAAFADSSNLDFLLASTVSKQLPVIAPAAYQTALNTSAFFFSLHGQSAYATGALQSLLSTYGWNRLAILYLEHDSSVAVTTSLMAQLSGYDVTLIALDPAATSYDNVIQALLQDSINIMVVITPYPEVATYLLNGVAQTPLMGEGRAWIYLQGQESLPTPMPQGVLVVELQDAEATNTLAFTSLLQSLDSTQYPGTGPSATAASASLLAYDAVFALADAIDYANAHLGGVSRQSISAALHALSTNVPFSGSLSFASNGFRNTQHAQILSAVATSTYEIAMTYNGTMTQLAPPVFPGPTLAAPDASIQHYGLAMLWALSGVPIVTSPFLDLCAEYILYRINHVPGLMPPNTWMDIFLLDDQGVPSRAVQNAISISQYGMISVIGDLTSTTTIAQQDVLSAFSIPQMSMTAADPTLSNKELYPTFLRDIPTSTAEGTAMLSLSQTWGWTEINIISTLDSYSASMTSAIVAQASSYGITVAKQVVLSVGQASYTDDLTSFANYQPRVLFMLADETSLGAVLQSMHSLNLKPNAVLAPHTIGSLNVSSLGDPLGIPTSFFEGWVVVNLPLGYGPVYDALLLELSTLDPTYWPYVPEVIPNVPALLGLLDLTLIITDSLSRCIAAPACNPRNGTQFLQYLWASNLTLMTGSFAFTSTGDRSPVWDIFNVMSGLQAPVGRWTPSGFSQSQTIIWPDGTSNLPLSVLPRVRTWLYWSSGGGIAMATIAAVGLLISIATLFLVCWFRQSMVIISSTWQFLILIIIGTMIGFGSTYVWIGEPQRYICALRIWLPPIAFLTILAPLLAKTWRLHRIFSLRDYKVAPIPLSRLVLIVVILLLIQIIICVFWVSLGTLDVVDDPDNSSSVYVVCGANLANKVCAYITYGYNGFLLVVGSYLGFRVRKLPKDFNESKWIGRTIYNTFLFAGLIIILGYALSDFIVTVLILICVCTLAICIGALILMLVPKIWTLWRHPEKRTTTGTGKGKTSQISHGSVPSTRGPTAVSRGKHLAEKTTTGQTSETSD